jgi:anti-sigma regulatory factor (Ser/Thr protein kinase)
MTIAAAETTSLIAFTLPSTPYSVRMARFYVRAALGYHDLDGYADDAETVASELVTNVIAHTAAPSFALEMIRLADPESVAVIVTDTSPQPPVKRCPAVGAGHGRGLIVVDAVSAVWGWRSRPPGKAVYAILTREA